MDGHPAAFLLSGLLCRVMARFPLLLSQVPGRAHFHGAATAWRAAPGCAGERGAAFVAAGTERLPQGGLGGGRGGSPHGRLGTAQRSEVGFLVKQISMLVAEAKRF